ncbi:MAG: hypothetical protein U5K75_10845 [Ahrensia sp.]|nr:hypothetical protein [Ahrensia sp.]
MSFASFSSTHYKALMISVFLHVNEYEAPKLARTLENLVPFAIDGFIQEVTLVSHRTRSCDLGFSR